MAEQERLPHDHAARAEALDPSRSFLVQAPAGSGKTELLTDRILALLATVNRPEEIVAITFTRKAASEMHARVLSKLRRGQGPMPEAMHERRSWELAHDALARNDELGWHLLEHPARLAIRTIDSFCAGLVRSMPWLSELGGMPEITDDARAHYEAAARATLDLADDFEEVRILLEHLDVDVQAAKDAIADMLGQRDQWLPLLAHGSDRESMEEWLADAIGEDLLALSDAMPLGWAEALSGPARLAATQLQEGGEDNKLAALLDWTGELPPDAFALDAWRALAHLLLTGTGSLRKTVNKNLGFPPSARTRNPSSPGLKAPMPTRHGCAGWTPRATFPIPPSPTRSGGCWRAAHDLEAGGGAAAAALLRHRRNRLHRDRPARGVGAGPCRRSRRTAAEAGCLDPPSADRRVPGHQPDAAGPVEHADLGLAGRGRPQPVPGRRPDAVDLPLPQGRGALVPGGQGQGIGLLKPEFLNLTDNFRSQAGVVNWVNRSFVGLMPRSNDPIAGAIAYSASTAFHDALPGTAVEFHPAWSRATPRPPSSRPRTSR